MSTEHHHRQQQQQQQQHRRNVQNFVLSEHPSVSDELLRSGRVTDINARYYYSDDQTNGDVNKNNKINTSAERGEGGGDDDPYLDEATKLLKKADYQQAIHMSALFGS